MQITITLDPSDPADVARACELLERMAPGVEVSNDDRALRRRVRSILKGYGEGRHGYVRLVADASPGHARFADIVALFESPKAVGGTHSSIERSWRAAGGEGMFITTDRDGDAHMEPTLAALTIDVLDELGS